MKPIKTILIFAFIWQLASWVVGNNLILPGVPDILSTLLRLLTSINFLESVADTFIIMVKSWIIISTLMLLITLLSIVNQEFRDITYNLFLGLQPTPAFAWLPMFMLLFGINELTVLIMMSFTGLCYAAPNFMTATKVSVETWGAQCKNLNLGLIQSLRLVYIPSMQEVILANFKTAWNLSWRTLIALEVVFGSIGDHWGIGTYMVTMKDRMDITEMYASLFTIITIGIIIGIVFDQIRPMKRKQNYGT